MKHFFLFLLVAMTGCSNPNNHAGNTIAETVDETTQIIQRAIQQSGGDTYDRMKISFDFRQHSYQGYTKDGLFEYVRIGQDSTTEIRDVLNNDGFYRLINGEKAILVDSMAAKYARSVNSVFYFALLPRGLTDPAVQTEYLGTKEIKGKTYDKIKVTFAQEGGGEDFEDIFIYWFDQDTHAMDYIAYLYYTDGGGMRFRVAKNPRTIGGIQFLDYSNLKPTSEVELIKIDDAYIAGELELLSEIITENISVTSF